MMTDGPPSEEGDAPGGGAADARAIRTAVRRRYGQLAAEGSVKEFRVDAGREDTTECCGDVATGESGCCPTERGTSHARTLGYEWDDLATLPEEAYMGLGCGNPAAIAELATGETVLDLGAGGGFDCFLAAREVGPEGHVIGVDMTPEMVERARANADKQGFETVEFRLGEIEHLPVADASVDVILSNCVVNLSPSKKRVFEEAFRVLKPGGRLAISDIVRTGQTPDSPAEPDPDRVAECLSGAVTMDTLREFLADNGFESVVVRPTDDSKAVIREMYDGEPDGLRARYHAAEIRGRKPLRASQTRES